MTDAETREPTPTARLGSAILDELRPAIETAFHVARSEQRSGGAAVQPPTALRRFLTFSRLPAKALDVVREAVDGADEFRAHVASLTEEHEVGELGWLWLARPDGWVDTLVEAESEALDTQRAADAEGRERAVRRRMMKLDADRRRLEAQLDAMTGERASLSDAIGEMQERLSVLGADLEAATAERDQLRGRQAELDRRATRAEAALGKERARTRELQQQLDEASAAAAESVAAVGDLIDRELGRSDAPELESTGSTGPDVESGRQIVSERNDSTDIGGAADAIAAAADLTASLSAALHAAADRLRPDTPNGESDNLGVAHEVSDGRATDVSSARRQPTPRRVALRVARGAVDDSVAGIEGLMAVGGIRVLVDGYNVAKTRWPDLALDLQRERLITSLASKLVTSDVVVDVVFDGANIVAPRQSTSPNVRLTWSPAGVTADDVIIDMVDGIDVDVPVMVVSSDHEVQHGARRRGANVVGSPAFVLWLA